MTGSATGPALRRTFVAAVWVYIGYNVVASVIGLIAKLPDLPATHAHTDHIAVREVLIGNGTIMSPPLVFMVVAALLLWGSLNRRMVLARICVALLILGVGLTAVDEAFGFNDKPSLYSPAKWHLAVTIGGIFVAIGAIVVGSGIGWLFNDR
jgi:hypothetical protein